MAPSRALLPLNSICAAYTRQPVAARRNFASSARLRFEDIRSESRLPRVATTTFWSSLVPKFLRRSSEPSDTRPPRQWNPYTTFILLAILVGSNAIQLIAIRNDTANFSRKTDAKLELLREVLQKVKNGEDVDVKRLLGTGDPKSEEEWEEVMKEIEETDVLWEGKKKRDAKLAKREKEKRQREEQERRNASPVAPEVESRRDGSLREGRPKFLM